jgi:hypothetical protein
VKYLSLVEVDPYGNEIQRMNIQNISYSRTFSAYYFDSTSCTWVQNLNLRSTLENGGNVQLSSFLFDNKTSFSFAGFDIPMRGNNLKVNLDLSSWPFQSSENSLKLFIQATTSHSGS